MIGLIVGLIAGAFGLLVGIFGGLFGALLGLFGAAVGLIIPLSPFLLLALAIWWLLKPANRQPTIR